MGRDGIRCTGHVSVVLDGREIMIFGSEGWENSTPLVKLVGRDVIAWRVESSHCFSVSLTDGAVLKFTSEDSPYEDFIIDPEVLVW